MIIDQMELLILIEILQDYPNDKLIAIATIANLTVISDSGVEIIGIGS